MGQVAIAENAKTLATVERVLAAPGAQHHFRVTDEIAIDRDLRAVDLHRPCSLPFRLDVTGRLAGSSLTKKQDVRNNGRALPFECIGRQTDRPDEIGLRAKIVADSGILFVERVMRRDQGQHATGLQGVDGLGEKVTELYL